MLNQPNLTARQINIKRSTKFIREYFYLPYTKAAILETHNTHRHALFNFLSVHTKTLIFYIFFPISINFSFNTLRFTTINGEEEENG